MDWKECNFKRLIKKSSIDEELIRSLVLSSSDKFETSKMIELSNITSTSKLSLTYDSLREILEALALKKGYKIYNHDCFSAFLLEILHEESFSINFDKFRKIRNKINYYGKRFNVNESKIFLEELSILRSKILDKYFYSIFSELIQHNQNKLQSFFQYHLLQILNTSD